MLLTTPLIEVFNFPVVNRNAKSEIYKDHLVPPEENAFLIDITDVVNAHHARERWWSILHAWKVRRASLVPFFMPWKTIAADASRTKTGGGGRGNPSTFFDYKGKMNPMISEKSPLSCSFVRFASIVWFITRGQYGGTNNYFKWSHFLLFLF